MLEKLRKYFDTQLEIREKLLDLSRKTVRVSAKAIFAIHRGENLRAEELLREARDNLRQIDELIEGEPVLASSGLVRSAQQEYSEAVLVQTLILERRIPEPEEVKVPYEPYLLALADSAGELRRYILDSMRKDEIERAREMFELMNDIFEFLMEFDYPDAIIPGIKHKQDVVRGLVERTRGELTLVLKQKDLSGS